MTFKQKVEEILIDGIKANEPVQTTLDHILAAYKGVVEGMPKITGKHKTPESLLFEDGYNKGIEACKSYLLEEVE
jgi:hypothetical protein